MKNETKTMAKPTPGPWIVHPMSREIVAQYEEIEGSAVYRVVAELQGDPHTNPISRANGNLIAAAPDLLAALKAIVAALDQPVQTSGNRTPETCDVLRGDALFARTTARAALARVEGGDK